MNRARLEDLGARRRATLREFNLAHGKALEAAVEELGGDDANVSQAAEAIGVTRRTIYAALERANNGTENT